MLPAKLLYLRVSCSYLRRGSEARDNLSFKSVAASRSTLALRVRLEGTSRIKLLHLSITALSMVQIIMDTVVRVPVKSTQMESRAISRQLLWGSRIIISSITMPRSVRETTARVITMRRITRTNLMSTLVSWTPLLPKTDRIWPLRSTETASSSERAIISKLLV